MIEASSESAVLNLRLTIVKVWTKRPDLGVDLEDRAVDRTDQSLAQAAASVGAVRRVVSRSAWLGDPDKVPKIAAQPGTSISLAKGAGAGSLV